MPLSLLLLLGCPTDVATGDSAGTPSDSGDTAGDTAGHTGDTAVDTDTAPACAAPTAITVEGALVPGQAVQLGVEAPGDPGPVAWSAFDGSDDLGPIGADGVWTVPETLAVNRAEDVTLSADACGVRLELEVVVDWPDTDRTVVIYNPEVEGSEAVARAYASFRTIPDTALCPVASVDPTTLAGEDYPAFAEAVFSCTQERTYYLVPVYGVPYKVSGRIADLASGAITTVSLDALLFGGPDSVDLTGVDYNPIYVSGDSTTGVYEDVKDFEKFRPRYDVYLVARIDGATPDDALALIERTRAAEEAIAAGTLDGTVYVDGNRGDTPPATDIDFGSYEWGEWNMWGTRTVFEDVALYDVVWDGNGEEFGTAPAPTECPDALYYAGWYSYYNYNDCFDWNVGAIGGHLDSCSACDIRNPGTWAGSALLDGITATFGAVNEPYVAGMPEYDQFFYYLLQGASYGEAAYESTVVSYWMMVWVGDPLYRPYGAAPPIARD